MKTIWKFKIELEDTFSIEMPKDAEILTIQEQESLIQMWALLNPNAEKEIRNFEIFGTGHPVGEGVRKYIGTFQLREGRLVFHLFERIEDLRRIIAMSGIV